MPKHKLFVTLPKQEIENVDVVFKVNVDGSRFGTLKVSSGALHWLGPSGRGTGFPATWEAFDGWVREKAKAKVKKTKAKSKTKPKVRASA